MLSLFGYGNLGTRKDVQTTLTCPLSLDKGPGLHPITEPIDALVDIVFVHGLTGGLVVQKALLHSDESPEALYNDLFDSTAGVIFMGTPHRGSTLANWGGLGTDFVHIVKDVNQAIVKLLRPESEILFQLRDSFIKLVIRRAKHERHALKIKCYFEELGMTLVGKVRQSITGFRFHCIK
ncbi:MAG: hypothetical protein Q9167_004156 [Letrouitia subvulpina]